MIVCSKKSNAPQKSHWKQVEDSLVFRAHQPCGNFKRNFKRKYPIAIKTYCMRTRSCVDMPVQHTESLLLIHDLINMAVASGQAGWVLARPLFRRLNVHVVHFEQT